MNFTKSALTILLASLLFVGCKEKTTPTISDKATATEVSKTKKEIAPENLQTATFTIEGMTCAMGCAKTIEGELAELEGVQTATVDFDKKLATVTFDKTVQNQETLTKVVEAVADGKSYKVLNWK